MTKTPHIAIIGAGPGGLASAVLLAARGCRVTLFEAQPEIGGRTARVSVGAYSFDRGPTFFLMPYVLEEIFAAAGRSLSDYATLTRLDPMYRLLIGRPGKEPITLDATQDVAQMARRIAAVEPADGPAFERFIADNRSKLRLMEPILRRPIAGPLDLLKCGPLPDVARVGAMLHPYWSVHQLLGRYFTNDHVKLAVCFQSKYLGMSPYDCPSLFTILPFIEYEYGVWHPTGGCHALMLALAEVAAELGVEVRTGAPVRRVLFSGPRATGLIVAGAGGDERIDADDVVINADAAWAIKNLIPPETRLASGCGHTDEHLDSRRYSCSTYMLYLGVRGVVDLPHHTIYVSARYRENLHDISAGGGLSEDPSVYVCNPSRTDPTLAPPGCSSLYVLVPTPNLKLSGRGLASGRGLSGPTQADGGSKAPAPGIDWPRDAAGLRRRTFEQLERIFGLRGIESRIEAEAPCTPEDWSGMNIQFGATFNLAHNLGQMLHKRPRNRLDGFENVYLVGGGTHPGSGLPTIFLSAQIADGLIAEARGLSRPRPEPALV
jgi:phytoene desaturase